MEDDNRVIIATAIGTGSVFELGVIRPLWHDIGVSKDCGDYGWDRGKRQKLPDGGCKGPQINRGKNKHRDRY